MDDKLSYSMTFYYKVLFPLLWIGGFGFSTLAMWLNSFTQPSQPPQDVKFLFLFFWIIGSAVLLRDALRLKSVSLEKDDLVVRNFIRVIRVPLRNINHISESRLMRPKTVSLTVSPPCEFVEKVTFIPIAKFQLSLNPLSEHPIVTKLRDMTCHKNIENKKQIL